MMAKKDCGWQNNYNDEVEVWNKQQHCVEWYC